MRQLVLAAALLALAACGQGTGAKQDAATATATTPAALMDQVQAASPEEQPILAFQQLQQYQAAHPDSQPPCTAVRAAESRGVIPANADPATIYPQYAGSLVFSIQCGALRSATRFDPAEHWLVIYAPGAAEVAVANCNGPRGDLCPRRVVPAATTTTTTP